MKRASPEPARRAAEKLIGFRVECTVTRGDGALVAFAVTAVSAAQLPRMGARRKVRK